jgi:hypothetical protein
MIFVGADPGISGALAALMCGDNDGPAFVSDAIDIPTMEDGKNREVDPMAIEAWVLRLPERPTKAFIENVTPMPSFERSGVARRSMGAASAFRFGGAAYALRTVFRMMRIRVELTHPATWKAHFKLKGGDKESSRVLALQLHPEAAHLLKRKMDHQRAEAMLLARHAAELRGMINGG